MSLQKDVIFIVSSEQELISQSMWDWVAQFAFGIEGNHSFNQYLVFPTSVRNLFTEGNLLLKSHLRGVQQAVLGYNISYYITQKYTYALVQNFSFFAQQSSPLSAYNTMEKGLEANTTLFLQHSPYANIFLRVALSWGRNILQRVFSFYETNLSVDTLLSKLKDDYLSNTERYISPITDEKIVTLVREVTDEYLFTTRPSTDDFLQFVGSKLVGGSRKIDYVSSLREIYAGGNISKLLEFAERKFLPFLRGEYIPFAFDTKILEFLLNSFTNYGKDSKISGLLLSVSLRSGLSDEDLQNLYSLLRQYQEKLLKSAPFSISLHFMNERFYYNERNKEFVENFSLMDYVAIILAVLLIWFVTRSLKVSLVSVVAAWGSSFIIRGITHLLTFSILPMSTGSVSIVNTLVFGAGINYTVFFLIRYIEELKTANSSSPIQTAAQFAIHSIEISGFAVFLTFVPIVFSSLPLFKEMAVGIILGILLQVSFMAILLPAVFSLTTSETLSLPHHILLLPLLKKKDVRKVLSLFSLVVVISILFLSLHPGQLRISDFAGGSGETALSYQELESKFPDTTFSKIVIEFQITNPLRDEKRDLILINRPYLTQIANKIRMMELVSGVYSYATPLGKEVDYNNQSMKLIEKTTVESVAEQFVNKFGNITYMFVTFSTGNSFKNAELVTQIRSFLNRMVSSNSDIVSYYLSGAPVLISANLSLISTELPVLIVISFLLLTAFLWIRMRSLSVPVRLLLSIVVGALIATALSTGVWVIITGKSLNIFVISYILIVLVALGTDFDIYLYSRICEEIQFHSALEKVVESALLKSSLAIELSGAVMISTFSTLLLSDTPLFKQYGLVISLAILLDITVVRQWLVPSLLLLDESGTKKAIHAFLSKMKN